MQINCSDSLKRGEMKLLTSLGLPQVSVTLEMYRNVIKRLILVRFVEWSDSSRLISAISLTDRRDYVECFTRKTKLYLTNLICNVDCSVLMSLKYQVTSAQKSKKLH